MAQVGASVFGSLEDEDVDLFEGEDDDATLAAARAIQDGSAVTAETGFYYQGVDANTDGVRGGATGRTDEMRHRRPSATRSNERHHHRSHRPCLGSQMISTLFGSALGSGPLLSKRFDATEEEQPRSRKRAWSGGVDEDDDDDDELSSEEGGDEEVEGDGRSVRSDVSASRRHAETALFHVPGVHCIGCVLPPERLAPVDTFVLENAMSKTGEALWRLAAHVYQATVTRPCQIEQSSAPDWGWVDLRDHYEQHVVHPKLFRVQACREMREMRSVLAASMVVVNDENGTRELDKTSLEQYLKVEAAESREYALIVSNDAATARATAGTAAKGGSALVPQTQGATMV
jgi:hypothetical protein